MSKTARSPLRFVAIQLGLFVFAIYYTFIGGQTAQGIYDPGWRSITLWLVTLLAGAWLAWRTLSRQKVPRTPLDWPLALLLAAWILATVFSVNGTYSRETLVFFVTYLFLFYMAADAGRQPWLAELILNAVLATSGLVWTLALLQLSWWYQALPPGGGAPLSLLPTLPRLTVLGNPNTMASYIALVMPLALYKLTTVRKTLTRLLVGLWVVMLAGSIFLTQSRGGLLALVVGVTLYAALFLWQKGGWNKDNLARLYAGGRTWLVVLLLFIMLALAALAWRGLNDGVSIRRQVISGALAAWRSRPLLGVGPGALGQELLRYQEPLDVIWADAHNLYLTAAAETGLVGAAGLLWLAGAGAQLAWLSLRRVNPARWPMASMACMAALAGFGAHNLVDSLLKYPLIMLLVAVLAGLWLGPYLGSSLLPPLRFYRPGSWSYPAIAAAGLLLVGNAWMGFQGIRNIELYNQAVSAAVQSDWAAAAQSLQEAERAAPNMPFYQRELGFVLGYLAESEPAARPEAIARYRLALAQIDRLAIDHANLGCLLGAAGQAGPARQEMDRARDLEPAHPLYRLNLGYYLEQAGEKEAAREEYTWVLIHRPEAVLSSFWQQDEQRRELLPILVERAADYYTGLDPSAWDQAARLYLAADEAEAALEIYETNAAGRPVTPPAAHLLKGQILAALNRPEPARAELEAALRLDPRSPEAYVALSRLVLAQGDAGQAEAHIVTALALERSPAGLYQGAVVAEARGDVPKALERYEAAWAGLTMPADEHLARYATEVARRRPMPAVYLPCLIRLYPTQLLIDLTQAEGRLLESRGDFLEASRVYRRLLIFEPALPALKAHLALLCQGHPETCYP